MDRLLAVCGLALGLMCRGGLAQVIEFDSNGLKFQTLTKSGVTVMFAQLPARLHEYTIIQVAVSNGSSSPYVIRPEDFSYVRGENDALQASTARSVVSMLMKKGTSSDVVRLVTTYEGSIYGNPLLNSTNGYEQRRQAALAFGGATKFRAAATASAIAFVQTRLAPGESTDGAVFFHTEGKPLSGGRLMVRTNTDTFEFKQNQSEARP